MRLKLLAFLLAIIIFPPRDRQTLPFLVAQAPNDGITDAWPALQAVVREAEQAHQTVMLPPGTYLLSQTLTSSAPFSFIGCGVQCSRLVANSNIALTNFSGSQSWPLTHGGTVAEIGFNCNSASSDRQGTGIMITDTMGATFRDIGIINCASGVQFSVVNAWDERNVFDHVTLDNFTSGILFEGPFSFGHNWFLNFEFNTYQDGDALFRLAGMPTDIYNVTVTANGNMGGKSCVFDLSGGQALAADNDIRVMVENGPDVVGFCGGYVQGTAGFWGGASAVQGHGFIALSPGAGSVQSGPFTVFSLIP